MCLALCVISSSLGRQLGVGNGDTLGGKGSCRACELDERVGVLPRHGVVSEFLSLSYVCRGCWLSRDCYCAYHRSLLVPPRGRHPPHFLGTSNAVAAQVPNRSASSFGSPCIYKCNTCRYLGVYMDTGCALFLQLHSRGNRGPETPGLRSRFSIGQRS
mgnify:CR=1 FL=1